MKPNVTPAPARPAAGRSLKPLLLVICLAAAGLLAHGIGQQGAATIENRHEGGRANPWRGLPGCLQMITGNQQTVNLPNGSPIPLAGCENPFALDDNTLSSDEFWGHAAPVLLPLRHLARGPSTTQVPGRNGEAVPKVSLVAGQTLAQGADVTLSLDPDHQAQAQALADCMTDPTDQCKDVGIAPNRWSHHYEQAGVRMVGLVDIEIATGRILAMASAHTACFAAHWTRSSAPAASTCPALPAISAAQPWRLDNHALFTTAMVASTNKPALMLGLLRSPAGAALHQGKGREWVLQTLKTSNSDALFDKLFCADTGFTPNCQRLNGLPQAAKDLGLDGGTVNLLPDQANSAQAGGKAKPLLVQNSRFLMHQEQGQWVYMPTAMPEAKSLNACSAQSFERCSGEKTANLVSELWGQGNAQATVLSAAQMMARLGAAANGRNTATAHLVTDIGGQNTAPQAGPVKVERQHARLIAGGLATTPQPGGTAHAACLAVWGAKTCKNIGFLAAKTGTPSFGHELLALDQRVRQCQDLQTAVTHAKASQAKLAGSIQADYARCHMQPHKWLVTLVKDSDASGAPYTRAVAVLAERNYLLATNRVDSVGDRGINVAAEMAFRYVAQTRLAGMGRNQ